jgi:ribosomal-protein-alanine N-acetyltransferase
VNKRSQIETRIARRADTQQIAHFLSNVDRPAVRNWRWHLLLGQETFLVTHVFGRLAGAFLACPEVRPIAWVRVAGLASYVPVRVWLEQCLPPTLRSLRIAGVRRLGWMDLGEWAGPGLRYHGFRQQTRLVTLGKRDRTLPHAPASDAHVRLALSSDIPTILRLDHAAFTPPWWLSAETLEYMRSTSACFIVAERDGECVGYAESQLAERHAHIGRLAVAPQFQHHGIGRLLLAETLERLWNLGARQVTLNTQEENLASQRLYLRSGFRPYGQRISIWERTL